MQSTSGDDEFEPLMRKFSPAQEEAAPQEEQETATVDGCLNLAKRRMRQALEEAVTVKTPCCQRVFGHFDGCFALRCHACDTFFCAWCLVETSANDQEMHRHVAHCPQNPHPGAVFGDYVAWRKTHLSKKKKQSITDLHDSAFGAFSSAQNECVKMAFQSMAAVDTDE